MTSKVKVIKVNPQARDIDPQGLLSKTFADKNYTTHDLEQFLSRAVAKPFGWGPECVIEVEWELEPEEECGTYGGYAHAVGIASVNLNLLARAFTWELQEHGRRSNMDGSLPHDVIELSQPMGELLEKHGFKNASKYRIETIGDYYEDQVISMKFTDSTSKDAFLKELREVLSAG